MSKVYEIIAFVVYVLYTNTVQRIIYKCSDKTMEEKLFLSDPNCQ